MLPLLYRFDSEIINFSIGPQVDYFLGWKNKNKTAPGSVITYSRPVARIAFTGSISKSFHLSPKWTLEPEGKLNYYPWEELGTGAINISLKRKIF